MAFLCVLWEDDVRANAFNFFNPEQEQAKASDGYRMKFGKQTRRSQAVLTPFLLLNFFKCVCPEDDVKNK